MTTWWRDRIAHLLNTFLSVLIFLIIYYLFFETKIQAKLDEKADIKYVNNAILIRYDKIIEKQDSILQILKKPLKKP